jgi:hypothetical protein
MNDNGEQGELFGLVWKPFRHSFRLRVNDVIHMDGRLGRVIRVSECAAVVLVNRATREFTTRFDKQVRFRPSAITVRISANAEVEILNRKARKPKKHRQRRKGDVTT